MLVITCREQAVQEVQSGIPTILQSPPSLFSTLQEEVVVTQVDVSAVHSEAASLCTTPAADIIITVVSPLHLT